MFLSYFMIGDNLQHFTTVFPPTMFPYHVFRHTHIVVRFLEYWQLWLTISEVRWLGCPLSVAGAKRCQGHWFVKGTALQKMKWVVTTKHGGHVDSCCDFCGFHVFSSGVILKRSSNANVSHIPAGDSDSRLPKATKDGTQNAFDVEGRWFPECWSPTEKNFISLTKCDW